MIMVQAAISTDASTFYITGNTFMRYSTTPGWVYHQVDISSYAGPGKPAVYIGLVGTSGYGNDIHIDDVSISSPTCQAVSGGMVSGFVSSALSGLPVISAAVSNTARPAELTYSMSRGEDPALPDGLYQLFSTVAGLQNFSATAIRHQAVGRNGTVVNNGVIRLDLVLGSAWTTALPNPVSVTLSVGASTTFPLVISNSGTMTAAFTIQPAASALTSGSTLSGPFPYKEEASNNPTDVQGETEGGKESVYHPGRRQSGP